MNVSPRIVLSLALLCCPAAVRTLASGPAPAKARVAQAVVIQEVTGLQWTGPAALAWDPLPSALHFNVYRGTLAELASGVPAKCHGTPVIGTSFTEPGIPAAGEGFFYLVTGADPSGEGPPGADSAGAPRPLRGSCDGVMRKHVFDRAGYGWAEWSRDRLLALGSLQAYIDEQLDPASIDESTNTALASARASLEPPETIQELQALDMVNAVYARRQLEHQIALFWSNHFNTEYRKSFDLTKARYADRNRAQLEAVTLHYREFERFRELAFNGTFREILEASSLSPAMILFLDTDNNKTGSPNENYAREVLELHTMGVGNGYTDQDIAELARVYTGWNVCKKTTADAEDPLAACISNSIIGTPSEPEGAWVANFRITQHDCGQKTLYSGTPYQTIIPNTCGNPTLGVDDALLAMDAIAAHPSTPAYVARKLVLAFVTDTPSQAMVDAVAAAWNDGSNPRGVGDLREVLRAMLARPEFLDPQNAGAKIKTPFEHIASALRALRGVTNGRTAVRSYLTTMLYLLHQNPIPTGYAEAGGAWVDTSNTLQRQTFGYDLATSVQTNFNADIPGLLAGNGISTLPGDAAAIVDFLAGALFGGALTPAERQDAIDFLNTDDLGVPGDYDEARIRRTAAYLLGLAQFQEQ